MFMCKQKHVINFVMALFKTLDARYISSCLQIIGNIIAADDKSVSELLNMGLLDILKNIFKYYSRSVKKEAFWVISNIAANSEEDAIRLVDSQFIINLIYATKDSNYEIRKEAVWAICNICFKIEDANVLNKLIEYELIHSIIDLINCNFENGHIMVLTLRTVEQLLSKSEQCRHVFEALGGGLLCEEL